ncbi:MAG: fold metallo-hydrolase [Proteobacteria bacterium]|nr:fold metallo-hydrolase [Pseudomonadota bacterium]
MFDFRDYGNGIYAFDAGYIWPLLASVHMVVEAGRVALVDTGTNDTLANTLAALEKLGLGADAVDYILLSHIHLDHAGGAGAMMQAFPQARLVVHPRGARHMAEPSQLVAGVTQVYGADYVQKMYGEILPIAPERIIAAKHETVIDLAGRKLLCLDAPGHARHHIAIIDEKAGAAFTGDLFGLSYRNMDVGDRQFLFPTTTPTQFDPEAMRRSVEMVMQQQPTALYLTHYGQLRDPMRQKDELFRRLDRFAAIAEAHRTETAERHTNIKAELSCYLIDEARTFGCTCPQRDLLDWWETDLELDAQGLEVWLDGLPAK